ncbi:LIPOPROTEIN [Mycoplasmopsis pulmonis]|uniref:LIPOPROTEIN n=1 Tax=Mycoplasmopsis pulmonis (strain UAB CTIP) TaxID=272635 RepID=Q98QP5_MYCPU|nr:hypothetical protein [Mycoplasmopsis pulmonis]CAC13489.1 LIPOPROTEIN [Mycoplasmopsis pulmonis]
MKNKNKIFTSLAGVSILTTTAFVVSCQKEIKTMETFEDKVIFQAAQGQSWPLMPALRELIKIYNQEFKNDTNFLPVELQDQRITKTYNEDSLARTTLEKLHLKKDDEIPNILLNSARGAFLINQYNRLLDLENSKITKDLFDDVFWKLHGRIPGSDIEKLYSIPFDIATIDALVFNIDIMAHIFDQIKAGGGKINLSETNVLKTKIDKAKTEGNVQIPEGKMWKYLVAKSSEAFKGYEVVDDSFNTYEGLQEFAAKVYENLTLQENLSPEIKEQIEQGADAKVFRIDYQSVAFEKFVFDRLNAYEGKNPYLWDFEVNKETGKTGKNLIYNFKNNENIKNILLDSYEAFVKDNHEKHILGSGTKSRKFKSIFYSTKGENDWSSRDILKYNTAFAYATHLGYKDAYNSFTTRDIELQNFDGNSQSKQEKWEQIQKGFTKEEDIYYTRQTTRMKKGSDRAVFYYGGSSLVPIKTTPKRDKATIKFIEWLLTGDLPNSYGSIKVKDHLRNTSRYVVPTADRLTKEEKQKIEKMIEQKTQEFNSLKAKENKSDDEIKKMEKAQQEKNFLISVKLSLEDILSARQANEYNKYIYHDNYTAKVWKTISTTLLNYTKDGGRKTSKEKLWEELMKIQEDA